MERELKLECPSEMKVKLRAVGGRRTRGNCTDTDKLAQQERLLRHLTCPGQLALRAFNLIFVKEKYNLHTSLMTVGPTVMLT